MTPAMTPTEEGLALLRGFLSDVGLQMEEFSFSLSYAGDDLFTPNRIDLMLGPDDTQDWTSRMVLPNGQTFLNQYSGFSIENLAALHIVMDSIVEHGDWMPFLAAWTAYPDPDSLPWRFLNALFSEPDSQVREVAEHLIRRQSFQILIERRGDPNEVMDVARAICQDRTVGE